MEQENERSTALYLAPSFVVMGWLVWQAQWFWRENPELGFGWLAPVLGIVLFVASWRRRPPVDWRMRWWVLAALVPGVGLLFLVQIYQASMGTNAASTAGLALGVLLVAFANLGIVFGWRGVLSFGMAYVLVLAVLPLPTIVHAPVSGVLRRMAAVDVEVLNLMGVPAVRCGGGIVVGGATLNVAGLCRGLGTMQFAAMASLFVGWMAFRRWIPTMLLLVGGLVFGVLGYFVCSLRYCMAVNAHGSEAARPAVWLVWGAVALGICATAWAVRRGGR